MSQMPHLLHQAVEPSLSSSPGASFKLPSMAQSSANPNSPNYPNSHTKVNKANKTSKATQTTKNETKPDKTPRIKRPSWINLENIKNDAWFRMTQANPEHKDTFERSKIPLPSPDCGAYYGQIYSPGRSWAPSPIPSPTSPGTNLASAPRHRESGNDTEKNKQWRMDIDTDLPSPST